MSPPGLKGLAPWLLTAASVWLGWQIIVQPLAVRLPPALAMRVAPESPSVLRRAAEAELLAGRHDAARELAVMSLSRGPFNARALRVFGLAEAENDQASADAILTLAGNWSLRDDPAHAWLVEHRLRQGDYGSAFAHADTLVRRRGDLQPSVFALFTLAASEDPRALSALTLRLAADPPWRLEYIDSLYRSPQGYQLAVNLALSLQVTRAPFTDLELHQLYANLLDSGRAAAIAPVRARLGRPPTGTNLINGDFGGRKSPRPFAWNLPPAAGVISEILPSPDNGDPALRVEYTGLSASAIAEQLMTLAPGSYRLEGSARSESGAAEIDFQWTVSCADGRVLGMTKRSGERTGGKMLLAADFTVPAGCTAQWLRLTPLSRLDSSSAPTWFDDLKVSADA